MRIYLTKNDTVSHCENNLVDIRLADGSCFSRLEPRRLFPVSSPNEYITLLDEDNKECAIIRSTRDLDAESQRVIKESLDDYYLIPEILRIISVEDKYGTLRWTVETDRGIKAFDIRNRNHDIRVSTDGRVRVRDADDNRYNIRNWHEMDKHSRSLLLADI